MHRILLLVFVALATLARGADTASAVTEPFRLYPRDVVRVSVQGEPEVGVERQIDSRGEINVPLLGAVKVGGLAGCGQNLSGACRIRTQFGVRRGRDLPAPGR